MQSSGSDYTAVIFAQLASVLNPLGISLEPSVGVQRRLMVSEKRIDER